MSKELLEAVKLFISQPINNPLSRGQIMEVSRIALPILEQQERGEGEWIEWGGGECPVHAHVKVEVKHRDSLCASTVSRAHDFDWNHYGYKFGPDIIAYRIIPERATNQNGEQ